jgi:hypothetical protein
LIIAGILGVAIALGVIALSSVLFREYWLVFNIYNFDKNHAWSSFAHYEDNSTVSNGEWKDEKIGPFVTAGTIHVFSYIFLPSILMSPVSQGKISLLLVSLL